MGKPSTERYKKMLKDVDEAVNKAVKTECHQNPFNEDDKRHARFERALQHRLTIEWLFDL